MGTPLARISKDVGGDDDGNGDLYFIFFFLDASYMTFALLSIWFDWIIFKFAAFGPWFISFTFVFVNKLHIKGHFNFYFFK